MSPLWKDIFKRKDLLRLILIIGGILFIFIGVIGEFSTKYGSFNTDIFGRIFASTVGIILIGLNIFLTLRRENPQIIKDLDRLGIKAIYKQREDVIKLQREIIQNSPNRSIIKIVGLTLNFLIGDHGDTKTQIMHCIKEKGCEIRFLLLDPRNDTIVAERDQFEVEYAVGSIRDKICNSLNMMINYSKELAEEYKRNIKIKLYNGHPFFFAVINDNEMIVAPYIPFPGFKSPILKLEKKGNNAFYDVFSESFDRMWKANNSLYVNEELEEWLNNYLKKV